MNNTSANIHACRPSALATFGVLALVLAFALAFIPNQVHAADYDYNDSTLWVNWGSGTRWSQYIDGAPSGGRVTPPFDNTIDNFYYNWQSDNHHTSTSLAKGLAFGANTMNNLYIDTSVASGNEEFYGGTATSSLTVAGTLYVHSTKSAERTLYFRGESGYTPSFSFGNISLSSTSASPVLVYFGYNAKGVNNVIVNGTTLVANGSLRFINAIGTVSLGEVLMTHENSGLMLATTVVGGDDIVRTVSVSGLTSENGYGSVQVSGSAVVAGKSLHGILTINTAAEQSYDYSGKIAHGNEAAPGEGTTSLSVIKSGAGVQKLTGNLNIYAGGTTIDEGTLLASNTLSTASATGSGEVQVNAGGALGGTGHIAGTVTVESGATLSPGDLDASGVSTAGTLTVNNTVTLEDGAVLAFNLAPGGGGDLLQVNGDLSLGSSVTLTALLTSGTLADGSYTLFSYTGTLSGAANLSTWSVNGLMLADGQSASFVSNFNTVYLQLGSIPEPATVAALPGVFGAIAVGVAAWRKRHNAKRQIPETR
ncbi:MAG: hypothetical protein LBK99_18525 [Opitutaceae bacterium]|jgi:autotransporter-associated beta strand protein|nr:hypothetical protein [Opitutaceae bacterium]